MSIGLMGFFIALLVLLVFSFIHSVMGAEKIDLFSRIQYRDAWAVAHGRRQQQASGSRLGKLYSRYAQRPLGDKVERFGSLLGLDVDRLQLQIELAGKENQISAIEVVILKMLGILFVAIVCIPVFYARDMVLLLGSLVLFTALYFLPEGQVRNAAKAREERVIAELPGFIEQVYLCIEAGANLKPALETVSERIGGDLGRAFHEAMVMAAYSGSWEKELLAMCERMGVEVLEEFVTDILNANEKGVSIVDALRNEVKHINRIHRSKIREKTEKLNSGMVVPVIIFFVLPVVAIIMVPILLQVMDVLM